MELVSNCCGARPSLLTEVIDGIGLCGRCREWASFEPDEDEDEKARLETTPEESEDS